MNIKKVSKTLFIIAIALFVIGTFFDWQIDTFLAGKLQFYGKFFETFGLIPITVVRVFCMVYIARVILFDNKIITYLIRIIPLYFSVKYTFGGLMTILFMGSNWITGEYLTPTTGIIVLTYIIAILITIVSCFYMFKIDRQVLLPLLKRVIMVFLITVIINQEVTFIKTHVGRARYYTVAGGLGVYTPWYQINGLTDNNDFMSFISGHTTTAFMAILPMFFTLPHQKVLRERLFIFGVTFGVLVAFSRMVLSQHYLTDTMGSFIISAITIYIMCKLFKVDVDGADLITEE